MVSLALDGLVGGREAQRANLRDVERELAVEEEKERHDGATGDATPIEAAIEAIFAKPVMAAERVRGTVASISGRLVSEGGKRKHKTSCWT